MLYIRFVINKQKKLNIKEDRILHSGNHFFNSEIATMNLQFDFTDK